MGNAGQEEYDYLARFAKKDETWRAWVRAGKKTEAEYQQWRVGQIMMGERWSVQNRF